MAIWRSVDGLLESLNAGALAPTYTMNGLRWLLRNRKTNGLQQHVRRPAGGRKMLIDEIGFRRWIEDQPTERPK